MDKCYWRKSTIFRKLRPKTPPTKMKTITKTKIPLRKRRPITKTNTLLKQVQKRLVLLLWTKIMFMRHTTKRKILTEILNSEFDTSVIYYGIFQR